jgi:2-succinyl-5-enolpyruvyl-6-hydroxy-3-cyclohexene-1-carboxylate synthase
MRAPAIDFRNTNSLWSSVFAETLARMGVARAVISPGSRSTPLAMAFAAHPAIEAIPVLDERSAGFFALGLARRQGGPVALLCTSGTAGANYLPAVIEAREGAVPLLVITADRPPEMRDCASGQTIDQRGLYGGYPVFHHELAVPEASQGLLKYLRQTAAHACVRTQRPHGGPVHLNAPFRDPLPPVDDDSARHLEGAIDWSRFFAHLGPPEPVTRVAAIPSVAADARGVIVAGPETSGDPAASAAALGAIAGRLGWPVLADGLSAARQHGGTVPHVVTTYDAILRNETQAAVLRPEKVMVVGGYPTSKVLRGWLESSDAETWMIGDRPGNRDALHGRTRQLDVSPDALAQGLPQASGPNGYERTWAAAEARARGVIDRSLESERGMFEPKAAWLLARHLPPGTPVFIASSMPVRDVEYVWPAGDRGLRPYFNRGANGIDGTLSSALGTAHGGPPAVLLTGDLALLHDANGFLIRPKFRGSLTIVLINNRGGGIFEHLPVARFEPPFEEFFATPQEVDVAGLCAAHGVDHALVPGWDAFTGLVSSLPPAGIRVLEVRTDRKRDAAGRRDLFREASAA